MFRIVLCLAVIKYFFWFQFWCSLLEKSAKLSWNSCCKCCFAGKQCFRVFVFDQLVHHAERQRIQKRMVKLKHLQQNQQAVTEAAEKAKDSNDLMTLLMYRTQVRQAQVCG